MNRRRGALGAALLAAVLWLAGAAVADRFFASGLDVTWRATHDGRLVVVDRTIEHRTRFENVHRALSRYVQGWHFDAWGVPEQLPDIDARIRTRLTVPRGPPLVVRAVSPNGTDLLDGGLRVEAPLRAGPHDLTIFWHGAVEPAGARHWTTLLPASFELRWGVPDGPLTPVPRSALELPPDTPDRARLALWIGAAVSALLLALGVFAAFRSPLAVVRARRAALLVTVLLISLGAFYRLFDYDVMPEFRENMDELFATWNGFSLLTDGTPRGWTLWPERYDDRVSIERVHYFRRRPIAVVTPYFEHPPLLHLMVGAAAKLGGASHFLHARLKHTRLVPIGLGLVTLLLVILVGRRLYPRGPAPFFAGLIYATLPYAVLMNRVIKEEALLAPLAMGGLLFFLRWRDDGQRTGDLVVAAALTGLCTLAKVPGLAFVVALTILVARRRHPRATALAACVGFGISALLLVYAAAIDWSEFWWVTKEQATIRGASWDQFTPLFYDTLINHNRVGRAWMIFLWLAFTASTLGRRPDRWAVLTVPAVAYLVAVGLASGSWHYGWYLLPILPLLTLGAGRFLGDLWERPELLRGTLFVVLPLMYGLSFLYDPKWNGSVWNGDPMRHTLRLFTLAALAPYGLVTLRRARPTVALARASTALCLGILVVAHGFFTLRYEVLYQTHHNFDDRTLCRRCEQPPGAAPSTHTPAHHAPVEHLTPRRGVPVPGPPGRTRRDAGTSMPDARPARARPLVP